MREVLTPQEQVARQPAIEVLRFISQMPIPKMQTLEDLQGFLIDNQIVQALAVAIELHGQLRSGYPTEAVALEQLPRADSESLFSATVLPKSVGDGRTAPSLLHIYYQEGSPVATYGVSLPIKENYSLDQERQITAASHGEHFPHKLDRLYRQDNLDNLKQHFAMLDTEQSPLLVAVVIQEAAQRMASILEAQELEVLQTAVPEQEWLAA